MAYRNTGLLPEDIEAGEHRFLKVTGASGSGKTLAILCRVEKLLDEGVAPENICVFTSTLSAVDELRAALAQSDCAQAANVRVETVRQACVRVLGTEQARKATGRTPRLLADFEERILMEDMKVLGMKQRRLREMLKFFYRSWTELADDDSSWLVSDEEVQVHRLLKDCLQFTHGLHEAEVANLAVGYLRSDEAALDAVRVDHVLVDDGDGLCKASQVLASTLARASLWVAGNAYGGAEAFEPYPCAAGLQAFAAEPGVALVKLTESYRPAAVVQAVNRMYADMDVTQHALEVSREREHAAAEARLANLIPDQVEEALVAADESVAPVAPEDVVTPAAGALEGCVEVLVLADADEEMPAMAVRVAEAVAAGTAPEKIAVAVPNRLWGLAAERALAAQGVEVDRLFDLRSLNGDIRDDSRCVAARALTLVRLAADGADAQAWRCWCAFGDWLANSPGVGVLRTLGLAGGDDLAQTLASLAAEGAADDPDAFVERCGGGALGADERASLERICAAYGRGRALAAGLVGYRGEGLARRAVEAACGEGVAVPAAVLEVCAGRDAAGAAAWIAAAANDGQAFGACGGARVGSLEALAGLEPELLVLCGFVNGFTPARAYFDEVATSPDRQRAWRIRELRRLTTALGSCCGSVLACAFTSMEATRAERLGLKVDRIKMRDGRRVASVAPSVFCGLLG